MLDKLEFLLLLAKERHFGRAAEAAGVTQPTFSSAVKSLEETLAPRSSNEDLDFAGLRPRASACSNGPVASLATHAPCVKNFSR